MARRRRSLLGNKGPVVPSAPVAGDSATPEPPDASEVDGVERDVADDPLLDAPPPPAQGATDDLWDSMRAPTPPPRPRRATLVPDDTPTEDLQAASQPTPSNPPTPSYAPGAGMEGAFDGLDDLYGGSFDDFDDKPPTEEVPAGLYQDVSTPYSAPMNVPEPPPIPGIVDRFTPPPVQRSTIGAKQTENRPSYLADPTPQPAPDRPSEKGRNFQTYEEELAAQRREFEDDDDEPRGIPVVVLLGGLGVAAVLALVIGGGLGMMLFGGGGGAEPAVEDGRVVKQVKVRNDMRAKPGLIGVPGEDAAGTEQPATEEDAADGQEGTPDAVDEEEPGEDEALEGQAEPEPEEQPEEALAAPAPAPKPPPVAPKPKPKPKPKVAPAPPPAADLGTLKIRANRRVLVYVDNKAIGYTPQDFKVKPGTYSVSAMVPGQPESKQTLDAKIGADGATAPVDFKF